uniref:Uncharacterized protein n=1 Tax=Oryza punctata TaxID=4537 RepID=A0A0E0MD33_ORYPU
METTAAAAADGKENASSALAALPRATQVAMCVLSLLFVAAAAFLLPRDGHGGGGGGGFEKEEEYFAAAVWRLSPLIGGYLLLWTAAVSWKTATHASVLLRVSFLLLLADATGEAAMFIGTVYTAAVLGYAIAERRRHRHLAGTDHSAAAAVAEATPAYESEAERAHRESSKKCLVSLVSGTAAAVGMFTMMLLPEFPPSAAAVMFNAVVFSGPYILCWALFVAGTLLRGEFISGAAMSLVVGGLGMWWLFFPVFAGLLLHRLVVALVVYWLTGMAMAGFLGYTLAVYDQYKELMASQPRTAADASGLLIGRETCDACPAEIDESASVRLSHQEGCFSVSGHCSSCRC